MKTIVPDEPVKIFSVVSAHQLVVLQQMCKLTNFVFQNFGDLQSLIEAVRTDGGVPVVLCDLDTIGDWPAALEAVKALNLAPVFVLTGRHTDDRLWGEVMVAGGWDVFIWPADQGEVLHVLGHAWHKWNKRQ